MDSVSAAEKRREIRRKKILMNSEDRMKKLHGYSQNDLEKKSNSDLWNGQLNDSEEGISNTPHYKPLNLIDVQDDLPDIATSTTGNQGTNDPLCTKMFEQNSTEPLSGKQQNSPAGKQNEHSTFDGWRLLIFLMVGIFVRLSFLTSFGAEYVQSLFNPFMALEIAVVGYQRAIGMDIGATVKGGLWYSALLLAGVKTEIITSYKILTGTIMAAASDFAVYIFAFIICHICL